MNLNVYFIYSEMLKNRETILFVGAVDMQIILKI